MKSRLFELNLPKSLTELNSLDGKNDLILDWSGAVNFLFVRDHLLIIKRSESMSHHKGQLAFVGGHKKDDELEPLVTAKREFEEETSFDANKVEWLGLAHMVKTARNNIIAPVISFLDMDPNDFLNQIRSNGEWTEAILVPYKNLLQDEFWVKGTGKTSETSEHSIYFFPILPKTYVGHARNSEVSYLLWGATAKMIWKFFKNYF